MFYKDEQRGGIEFQNNLEDGQRIPQKVPKHIGKKVAKQVSMQSDSEKSIGLVSIRFEQLKSIKQHLMLFLCAYVNTDMADFPSRR